jgi:hypothetical protein
MADMAKVMSIVREYSDARLADVLSGKDMSVPQFAAMTEAMGRKQLRQAVDGQQAMQQAQQPSVKDQLLAEQQAQMGGIASLPAPNMESVDMAGGGIIAFDDGGYVPGYAAGDYIDPLMTLSGLGIAGLGADEARREDLLTRKKREEDLRKLEEDKQRLAFLREAAPDTAAKMIADNPALGPSAGVPAAAVTPPASSAVPPTTPAAAAPAAAPAAKEDKKEGIAKLADRVSYLDSLQDVGKDIRGGIADIKNAKQSDILLAGAKALLGNATLAKAGSDFAGSAIELGGKSRKEVNELTKVANDYDFNIAKAREAAAQGNDELAYKYEALAEQAKYRAGVLGIQGQRLGMMQSQYNDIKVPAQLSKVYADAKKEVDAAYNNMVPASKRAQYQKDIDAAYRKRAGAVGLGKYVDTYSPGASAYNVVQSPRKGAQTLELDEV